MILSADDEVTIAEIGVIIVGIAITWAVYRRGRTASDPPRSKASGGSTPADPADSSLHEEGE